MLYWYITQETLGECQSCQKNVQRMCVFLKDSKENHFRLLKDWKNLDWKVYAKLLNLGRILGANLFQWKPFFGIRLEFNFSKSLLQKLHIDGGSVETVNSNSGLNLKGYHLERWLRFFMYDSQGSTPFLLLTWNTLLVRMVRRKTANSNEDHLKWAYRWN